MPRSLGPFALAMVAAGCLDGESPLTGELASCSQMDAGPPSDARSAPITYAETIQPITRARCTTCHATGGTAPFSLESYQDLVSHHLEVREAVTSGSMPPWPAEPCCNRYRDDASLTEAERNALIEWIDDGLALGEPSTQPDAGPDTPGGLSRVDLSLRMADSFTPDPREGATEVRCFLLDHRFDDAVYAVGIDVVPENRAAVHQVGVLMVTEDAVEALAERDREDDRAGWDCGGELADDHAAHAADGLYSWTPGSRPTELPDGVGRAIAAGSHLVLTIEYDTIHIPAPDRTRLDLMLASEVRSEARTITVANPIWPVGDAMLIRAGDPDASVFFAYDPTDVTTLGDPLLIYSVALEMHHLGRSGRLAVLRSDGSSECLLEIDDWEPTSRGTYDLALPVRVDPGDRLFIECHWDNSAENQRLVGGERETPRDLGWGPGEEMCIGLLTIAEL